MTPISASLKFGQLGTWIVAERERKAKERERDEAIYGL